MTESTYHKEVADRTIFGFWVYLMTDCILFASLFAAYAVLHKNNFGGPTTQDLFDLPFALTETMILLVSSFTSGIAMLGKRINSKAWLFGWFAITFILGASFIGMELHEFRKFIAAGHTWQTSASLSSFFTLVATHGCHVSIGLLWMIVLLVPVWKHGLTSVSLKRLTCLRMFWHFLDVVWIFIFTLVYLLGAK